ncbi:MAG TPA: M20/M25/M40 family metallo-hydrolase [Thermoanaerobaculia bacterium]
MITPRRLLPVLFLIALIAASVSSSTAAPAPDERVDLDMMTRIRAEGLQHSQVMDTLLHLTDVIGPRLTGSPAAREANEWTRQQLAKTGLVNAHLEAFPFGRGWSFRHAYVRLVAPREQPVFAIPEAWTPGTKGPVRGPVMRVKIESEKDFDQYKGKLAGKILLLDDPFEVKEPEGSDFKRYTPTELGELAKYEAPPDRGDFRSRAIKRRALAKAQADFLVAEKALATISVSPRESGVVRVTSHALWERGAALGVPSLVMASEPYDTILRLVADDRPVELEIDVDAQFYDDAETAYDTVAEIPGGDKRGELVMAGAHLDSWHAGTGATDNAAGCAVVMEAVRILKAVGAKPRRTVRVALWTGEEQGLLGSRYYVKDHFAARPEPTDPAQKALPEFLRDDTWPLELKPEHRTVAAYFNVDNGSGKIRGIYTQENAAVRPIFEAWLEPLRDLGADTVTLRDTGGTDHQSFDRVGLPGFQFIQDELDYENRTHHTNLDVFDRARAKDLEQAAVVLAAFIYDAAMRPDPLPRKPLPTRSPRPPEKKEKDGKKP